MFKDAHFALVLVLVANYVQAQSFEFISSDGEALATIEFSELPASLTEFVSLTFTPTGEEIFGFGSVYTGEFDALESPGNGSRFVTNALDGTLGGIDNDGVQVVSLVDRDPPTSEAFTLETFAITAALERADSIGTTDFFVGGEFRPVPEPAFRSWPILVISLLVLRRENSARES